MTLAGTYADEVAVADMRRVRRCLSVASGALHSAIVLPARLVVERVGLLARALSVIEEPSHFMLDIVVLDRTGASMADIFISYSKKRGAG